MYRTIAKIIDINTTTKHGSRLHEKDCAVVGVASSSSAPESDDLYLDLAAVIEKIRAGDFPLLVRQLRDSKFVDQEILNLAADIIEGKLKRPAHRAKTIEQQNKHIHIAAVFHFMRRAGIPYKKARFLTAKKCGCTERTVETAVSACKIVVANEYFRHKKLAT